MATGYSSIRAGRAFVELFALRLRSGQADESNPQVDNVALLAAVWPAPQACFIRPGIANEVAKAQQ